MKNLKIFVFAGLSLFSCELPMQNFPHVCNPSPVRTVLEQQIVKDNNEFIIDSSSQQYVGNPSVSSDKKGSFFIAWRNIDNCDLKTIWLRKFDSKKQLLSSSINLSKDISFIFHDLNNSSKAFISSNSLGNTAVLWTDEKNPYTLFLTVYSHDFNTQFFKKTINTTKKFNTNSNVFIDDQNIITISYEDRFHKKETDYTSISYFDIYGNEIPLSWSSISNDSNFGIEIERLNSKILYLLGKSGEITSSQYVSNSKDTDFGREMPEEKEIYRSIKNKTDIDFAINKSGNYLVVEGEYTSKWKNEVDIFAYLYNKNDEYLGLAKINSETIKLDKNSQKPSLEIKTKLNDDNSFIVIWGATTSENLQEVGQNIYARRFNSDLEPLENEWSIFDNQSGKSRFNPDLEIIDSENYIIVSQSLNIEIGEYSIIGKIIPKSVSD